ncbi:MAG: molybdopterin molybdotransferase MoeA [Anaerolineae bacterium]|nr:molybdopterin molybdotransferase MoeA [Phycisphaerae bacterium]
MSEPDVSNLLTVAQAIEIIDSVPVSPRIISQSLLNSAGLRLAQDIIADRDYPPFDKSLMDGFAIRVADAIGDAFTLRVVGEIAAGKSPSRTIGAGECMSIYTGAPMPDGADSVVPVEFAENRSGDSVTLRAAVRAGQNIARRGADCPAGKVLLTKGSRLTPAAIAVAASVGAAEVQVFAPPRVVVLSSGDELVPIDQSPLTAQIRNSNGPMLVTLLQRLGCDARDAGWAQDEPAAIRAAIQSVIDDTDVLVLSGGMSMGEYDFIPRVLKEMGVDLRITKLKIKPGKPFVFGTSPQAAGTFVFGLPGNPVSGFACTIRLCSRLLARVAGGSGCDAESWIHGPLTEALPANGPREFYQPAILNRDGSITPLQWKGSADIYTLARANALLVRAENEPPQNVGTNARVLLIPT